MNTGKRDSNYTQTSARGSKTTTHILGNMYVDHFDPFFTHAALPCIMASPIIIFASLKKSWKMAQIT